MVTSTTKHLQKLSRRVRRTMTSKKDSQRRCLFLRGRDVPSRGGVGVLVGIGIDAGDGVDAGGRWKVAMAWCWQWCVVPAVILVRKKEREK